MGTLVDWQIRNLCGSWMPIVSKRVFVPLPKPLMDPFSEGFQDGVVSYGLTHSGYDVRLGYTIKVFKNTYNQTIGPKRYRLLSDEEKIRFDNRVFDTLSNLKDGETITVPPHGYILGYSLERFIMPRNVRAVAMGKSTYVRWALGVNMTPLEPGWQGYPTLELFNASCCPVEVVVGEGICQIIFERLDEEPEQDYGEKGGKYQNQGPEPVLGRTK